MCIERCDKTSETSASGVVTAALGRLQHRALLLLAAKQSHRVHGDDPYSVWINTNPDTAFPASSTMPDAEQVPETTSRKGTVINERSVTSAGALLGGNTAFRAQAEAAGCLHQAEERCISSSFLPPTSSK